MGLGSWALRYALVDAVSAKTVWFPTWPLAVVSPLDILSQGSTISQYMGNVLVGIPNTLRTSDIILPH